MTRRSRDFREDWSWLQYAQAEGVMSMDEIRFWWGHMIAHHIDRRNRELFCRLVNRCRLTIDRAPRLRRQVYAVKLLTAFRMYDEFDTIKVEGIGRRLCWRSGIKGLSYRSRMRMKARMDRNARATKRAKTGITGDIIG